MTRICFFEDTWVNWLIEFDCCHVLTDGNVIKFELFYHLGLVVDVMVNQCFLVYIFRAKIERYIDDL